MTERKWNEVQVERKGRVGQLYTLKIYFTYGHSHWLGFLVSIGTFMMVAFQFLTTYWAWFAEMFGVIDFILFAIPTYFLVAVLVGRWDYKRGPYKNRAAIEWRENPVVKELFETLIVMGKQLEEIQKKVDEDERK